MGKRNADPPVRGDGPRARAVTRDHRAPTNGWGWRGAHGSTPTPTIAELTRITRSEAAWLTKHAAAIVTHLVDTYPAVLADDPGTGWRATIDELRDAKADAVPGILLRAWPLSASAMITALATMLGVEPPGRLQ